MEQKHPNSIKKSLRLLQVEKIVIILKELENIKSILDFFNGYNTYQDISENSPIGDNKEKKEKNKPIKRTISYLRQDIKNLEKQIQQLQHTNNELKNSESMLFIIQYDYIRTQIEDMLRVIHALYNKMQQLFGETLNQYLPYPVLGRRYSNNGIMMYLGNYYREMLKTFSPDHTNKLILGWNYRTGFQYRIFVNRELKREHYEDDTYNDYIDLPYWYYELPILLPSITHEVAYIALRNPSESMKKPYSKLKTTLKDFLDDTNNVFVQKIQDVLAYDEYGEDLTKVIFCDIVGYKTHGKSYINALFHDIIGEKLAKDYLKIIHHKNNEKSFKLISNEWFFMQKKDHSILRLHFLLSILYNENEEDKDYESMKEMIDSIMPISDENQKIKVGFFKIYTHNYPNLKDSYLAVKNYLSQLLTVIQQWEVENREEIAQIITPKNSPNFNKLWKERYKVQKNLHNPKALNEKKDLVIHQNIFRREIHTIISGIDYLKDYKDKIENNEEHIIYLMELGKARKDVPISEGYNINKLIENEIDDNSNEIGEKDDLKLSVYGIYDWITIKRKDSIIDISDRFQELIDKTKNEYQINTLKYFKAKQILMKVHQGILGGSPEIKEDFSVIFNIEIAKKIDNEKCTNGYNNLNKSIKNIANTLHNHKDYFKKADIYKSLGPKDITVIIQESSLESIFKILEALNQHRHNLDNNNEEGEVLRTFTMLCSPFGTPATLKKPFSLISNLRVSNEFKKDNIQELIDKTIMDELNEVTGIMDFRIKWKEGVEISEVLEFYNRMTEKSYLTDFQTKIEKEISLI